MVLTVVTSLSQSQEEMARWRPTRREMRRTPRWKSLPSLPSSRSEAGPRECLVGPRTLVVVEAGVQVDQPAGGGADPR